MLPSDGRILQLYEAMRGQVTYPCDLQYSDVSWDCPRGDEVVSSQILWSLSSRRDGYSKCIFRSQFPAFRSGGDRPTEDADSLYRVH